MLYDFFQYNINRKLLSLINLLTLTIFYSCSQIPIFYKEFKDEDSSMYFLGKANTQNFQITCEELLQFYGYFIDSYENDQLTSKVITKWKIRDPYESETMIGYLEVKTRIIIKAEVISNSYTRTNGYTYNCFLYYENVGFKNNRYNLIKKSPEFTKYLFTIIDHFREKLQNLN